MAAGLILWHYGLKASQFFGYSRFFEDTRKKPHSSHWQAHRLRRLILHKLIGLYRFEIIDAPIRL
jgi:hypothetical protein